MRKLFVSLPMRGRDDIDVLSERQDLKKMVEDELNEEFELIESFIQDNPPEEVNDACWYLGNSIVKLSEADLVIFSQDWRNATGCIIEHMVCAFYNIPYVDVEMTNIDGNNIDPTQVEIVRDYTHSIDEQPIEFVDKIDISHDDVDDYDPDSDELEPGEYNADLQ